MKEEWSDSPFPLPIRRCGEEHGGIGRGAARGKGAMRGRKRGMGGVLRKWECK